MTAKKDWGGNGKAAEHNKLYYKWKNGRKELKIWSGSGHGVEILKTKESTNIVVSWLKNNLGKLIQITVCKKITNSEVSLRF